MPKWRNFAKSGYTVSKLTYYIGEASYTFIVNLLSLSLSLSLSLISVTICLGEVSLDS